MRLTIDADDLAALASDYGRTPERAFAALEPVVERGAMNVKRDARSLVLGQITGTFLPHYPRAIDYDVAAAAGWIEAEIGPDDGKPQGGMGRGVEFGSAHTAPIPHLHPAYEQEVPRFARAVGEGLVRSLP